MEAKLVELPKHVPENFKPYGGFFQDIMTNSDHTIDKEVAEAIKGKELFSTYTAWEFCGIVWWDSSLEKWCCQIDKYRTTMEIIIEDTLEEIMSIASDKYGAN